VRRLASRILERFERLIKEWNLQGVKLYTAEWHGSSKCYKLTHDWCGRHLEKAQELGVKNIYVRKGPTIWPVYRDAFDVPDIDDVASQFNLPLRSGKPTRGLEPRTPSLRARLGGQLGSARLQRSACKRLTLRIGHDGSVPGGIPLPDPVADPVDGPARNLPVHPHTREPGRKVGNGS
jgi:hypothetical protein